MDPKTEVLSRERICFLWNNQYFELDNYRGRHDGLTMLLVESPARESGMPVLIPPFLTIGKRVTDDLRYTADLRPAKEPQARVKIITVVCGL
jgi:CYTH domain-containing protein